MSATNLKDFLQAPIRDGHFSSELEVLGAFFRWEDQRGLVDVKHHPVRYALEELRHAVALITDAETAIDLTKQVVRRAAPGSSDAEKLHQELAILEQGQLEAQRRLKTLLYHPPHPELAQLIEKFTSHLQDKELSDVVYGE